MYAWRIREFRNAFQVLFGKHVPSSLSVSSNKYPMSSEERRRGLKLDKSSENEAARTEMSLTRVEIRERSKKKAQERAHRCSRNGLKDEREAGKVKDEKSETKKCRSQEEGIYRGTGNGFTSEDCTKDMSVLQPEMRDITIRDVQDREGYGDQQNNELTSKEEGDVVGDL